MQSDNHYLQPTGYNDDTYAEEQRHGMKRENSFLTAPEGGWLHNQFALQYGEGVFFSFPVTYVGRIELSKSLRTVEFPIRHRICQEAIARVREAAHTRDPIDRDVDNICSRFLDENDADVRMQDIVLNISVEGIVLATPEEENVIAHHRMTCISYACGGDFEDYEQVAYVAKTRLGRICYVFDCAAYSNQVLATLGQAFVTAGEIQDMEDEEYEDLDEEYDMYQDEYDGMTQQEYEDLYGQQANLPSVGTDYSQINDQTYEMAAGEYATSAPLEANGGAYADVDTNADLEAYSQAMGHPDSGSVYYNNARGMPASDGHYNQVNEQTGEEHLYNMPSAKEANPNYSEYTMADKESHYSDAAFTEANPNYHEVSLEAEPEYEMGDPNAGMPDPTYTMAANVKSQRGKGKQARGDDKYDMAANTQPAADDTDASYSLAKRDATYTTANHVAAMLRDHSGRQSMQSTSSTIYARETMPGHAKEAREGNYSQLTRQELAEEEDDSDEEVEVRTVASAPRGGMPSKGMPPLQRTPSEEDDNGWSELAKRDATKPDTGYLEGNYLEGEEEEQDNYLDGDDLDGPPAPPPVSGIAKAKKKDKKKKKADNSSYLKISPRRGNNEGSQKRKGLFGRLKKNKNSTTNIPAPPPAAENYLELGDEAQEQPPQVEAVDYSKIESQGDGAYSAADELAGNDSEDELDESEVAYQARKERLRTESVYSKPERRQAPPLPEKSGTEVNLVRESIKQKPLQSKGDLLVRKLNAKRRGSELPETAEWNYIDPENLEEVEEQ